MDYEVGIKMLDTHCCSQCGKPLSLIWDAEKNNHELVCGSDRSHQGYQKMLSTAAMVAQGRADELIGKGGQADTEKQLAKAGHPLSMLPTKDLGTDKAIDAKALESLVRWGLGLELKPYLGHVCLYYGKPYVTIDGYYYKLHDKDTKIKVGTRPLYPQERATYQIPEGAYAWLAEGWLEHTKLPTTGLGIVTKEEIEGKSERNPEQWRAPVVHAHPQRMAEKRAEWQLLRKLLPLEEEK